MDSLAHYLLDVMTNSWEANATEIEILVNKSKNKNTICFTVTDNGKGISESFAKIAANKGTTTKKGTNRGLGLYLLKTMTQECEGDFHLTSNKGTCIQWSVKYNNPKRKPIGDIAGIIATFIYSHKNIRVRFTYISEENSFSCYSPELSCKYNLKEIQSIADLRKLKEILQQNLELINYNK